MCIEYAEYVCFKGRDCDLNPVSLSWPCGAAHTGRRQSSPKPSSRRIILSAKLFLFHNGAETTVA